MQRVKTAVVGVGSLGRHHLRWLHEIPESELVGFYDIDTEKREKYQHVYPDIKSFSSLDDVAAHTEAVSIAVPTQAHFEVASFFIKRGIHCLIEKPITATLEEALALQELIDTTDNLKVAVGHIERFNPAVLAVLQHEIKPAFIEAHRLSAFDPRGTDVAVVRDLMIHDIDLVLTFIPSEVVDIQASSVAVVSEQADIANARLTFANGAVANLTASRISLHKMRKLRIFQQSGYFSLDLAKRQADLYRLVSGNDNSDGFRVPIGTSGKELLYTKTGDTGKDMLAMELTSFLQAIIQQKPVEVPLKQGIRALQVALKVEQAGQEALQRMLGENRQP